MAQSTWDSTNKPAGSVLGDESCPKCGTAMEPIDTAAEGLAIRELQLCPNCYLVTWHDDHGFQTRQGFPMEKGTTPGVEPRKC